MPARRPSSPPIAYSYVRFSSPEQARGDSIRRQTELRDAWVKKTGALLDTSLTFRDEGVSGFTGSHRENEDRNALAAFLKLVERKRVARGSYLIVESLDRLTREHIRPALTLLLNLIEAGVRVVQLLPAEAIYDENVEPMALMQAIMELSRGHSESRMKSERLGRAWKEKKLQAKKAGTPLTRAVPGWLKVAGTRIVIIEERAAAVRRVYQLAIEGHGLGVITKRLNAEKVKPIGRAPHWARSYVSKLLASRATIGEYQPHKGHAGPNRKPDGAPVSNYYPPIITEDEWHRARAAIGGRRSTQGRPSFGGRIGPRVPLFSGLLHDARDGGPLHQANKGERASGPILASYRAAQGLPGSKYVAFPLTVFEDAILSRLREIDPREILPHDESVAARVATLSGRLMEIEGRIAKVKEALAGDEIESVVDVLRTLDVNRKAIAGELAAARQEAASPLSGAWRDLKTPADVLRSASDAGAARTRLRGAIRRTVSGMWCLFVAKGLTRRAVVQVWFEGGGHRDYLILYHGARSKQSARVVDFKAPGRKGELDLREKKHAAPLERILEAINMDNLGDEPAAKRRVGKK